jgi:hypothetical protein
MTLSEAIASNYGLAFSISPAKKRANKTGDDEDEEYKLTLAPFTKAPKINFGQVKVNQAVERNLLIINPQEFEVKLKVSNDDLKINNMEITIAQMTNIDFKIKWQPDKPDNYKYSILFEVTNCARLKFLVHAFGVCLAPEVAKKHRKPLTMLQPIKKEKTTVQPASAKPQLKAQPVSSSSATMTMTVTKKIEAKLVTNKENKKITTATATKSFSTTNSKKNSNWNPNIYKTNDDEEETEANIISQESKFDMFNQTTVHQEPMQFSRSDDFDTRRQTCIIKTPKMHKKKFYSSQENLYSNDEELKTPTMGQSVSIDNFNSLNTHHLTAHNKTTTTISNNLSFIDQTVIVVAGVQEDVTIIPNESRHSPGLSSTWRKPPALTPTPIANSYFLSDEVNSKTPKLSDFIKKITPNSSSQFFSFSEKSVEHLESSCSSSLGAPGYAIANKIASTHLVDISVESNCKIQINESTIPLIREHLHETDEVKLVKSVVVLQRAWRARTLRRNLRETKRRMNQERINQLLASTRDIVMSVEQIEREQDELLKSHLEKSELDLRLIEQAKQEREANLIKQTIKIQRAFRMKRFRNSLHHLLLIEQKRREQQAFFLKQVVKVQQAFRMKLFRLNLTRLLAIKKFQEQQALLLKHTINIQRAYRMKRFRAAFSTLKKLENERVEREAHFLTQVLKIQRAYRLKLFRVNLNRLKAIKEAQEREAFYVQQVVKIQRAVRMKRFRSHLKALKLSQAATKIQHWFSVDMKQRLVFLRLKRSVLVVQRRFRLKFMKICKSALVIQSTWRMYCVRRNYLKQMNAAIFIQQWFRSKCDRLKYLKLKRAIPFIQTRAKIWLNKRHKAASLIQKSYRMHVFRKHMRAYRQSAVKLQHWHRSMHLRYVFLKQKRAIIKIQARARVFLAMRLLNEKRIEYERRVAQEKYVRQMNRFATKIQAYWRGYMVRKSTSHLINGIRNRLSIYIQSGNTLGSRIHNSLKILRYPCVPIQQLITALSDLDKVTRLSPECCLLFTREGALNILYTFISSCNRSVPHMDLIKYCVQIFTNLAKYNETQGFILEPTNSLSILLDLLQAFHTSNPNIFMDVCVLFIILAQNDRIADAILSHEGCVKKLQTIYQILERRACIRMQKQQQNQMVSTIIASKDQLLTNSASLNTTYSKAPTCSSNGKKVMTVTFTFAPEWNLNKKDANIQLLEPLGALEYLVNTLDLDFKSESQNTASNVGLNTTYKTPSKRMTSTTEKFSTKKKGEMSEKKSLNKTINLSASSSKQSMKF